MTEWHDGMRETDGHNVRTRKKKKTTQTKKYDQWAAEHWNQNITHHNFFLSHAILAYIWYSTMCSISFILGYVHIYIRIYVYTYICNFLVGVKRIIHKLIGVLYSMWLRLCQRKYLCRHRQMRRENEGFHGI